MAVMGRSLVQSIGLSRSEAEIKWAVKAEMIVREIMKRVFLIFLGSFMALGGIG